MPKYIVKEESIIREFIGSLFKAIGKKEGKKALEKIKNDPELVKLIKQGEKVATGSVKPLSVPATLAVYPLIKWYIAWSGVSLETGGRTP